MFPPPRVWIPSLVAGLSSRTSHLDSLVISYKTKHTLNIWSSNQLFWYSLKVVESLSPHKNLHMGVYNRFIHNFQVDWKQSRWPSIGEWINCDNPDNGILFSTEKKWAIKTMKRKNLKKKFLSKRRQLENTTDRFQLYNILEMQNYKNQ